MIWDSLRYFKPQEFNRPDKMSGFILWALDEIRHWVGLPCVVTSAYRAGGSGNHEGYAVDCYFVPGTGANRLSAIKRLERVMLAVDALQIGGASGIGLYLDWSSGNLGFHFDFKRGGARRWSRDGEYKSWKYAINRLKNEPERW